MIEFLMSNIKIIEEYNDKLIQQVKVSRIYKLNTLYKKKQINT